MIEHLVVLGAILAYDVYHTSRNFVSVSLSYIRVSEANTRLQYESSIPESGERREREHERSEMRVAEGAVQSTPAQGCHTL